MKGVSVSLSWLPYRGSSDLISRRPGTCFWLGPSFPATATLALRFARMHPCHLFTVSGETATSNAVGPRWHEGGSAIYAAGNASCLIDERVGIASSVLRSYATAVLHQPNGIGTKLSLPSILLKSTIDDFNSSCRRLLKFDAPTAYRIVHIYFDVFFTFINKYSFPYHYRQELSFWVNIPGQCCN